MLQRIQTIYWLINVALIAIAFFLLPWTTPTLFENFSPFSALELFVGASLVVHLITIFSYKKRSLQLRLGNLLFLFHTLFLVALNYHWLTTHLFENKEWSSLLTVTLLFLVLAHRAVRRDDRLVKSVDRIR